MSKKAEKEALRNDSIERLRKLLPLGASVSTVVTHVTASGMSRSIMALLVDPADHEIFDITYLAATALDRTTDSKRGGVVCKGCGMDMAFELVYSLAQVLHGDGYALKSHRV